jgi:hypothetical protein
LVWFIFAFSVVSQSSSVNRYMFLITGLSGISQLDDILETESEITISARPPSNLDDESLIQTPDLKLKPSNKQNKQLTPAQVYMFSILYV